MVSDGFWMNIGELFWGFYWANSLNEDDFEDEFSVILAMNLNGKKRS